MGVITGEVAGCKGIHIRAQTVHTVGNGLAVKGPGTPKREMFQQVRTAPLARTFITAANIDEQGQRS
jgi:hypothetical protein